MGLHLTIKTLVNRCFLKIKTHTVNRMIHQLFGNTHISTHKNMDFLWSFFLQWNDVDTVGCKICRTAIGEVSVHWLINRESPKLSNSAS